MKDVDENVQFSFCSRQGQDRQSKFGPSHAFMILVSTESESSYRSIDEWRDLIRKKNKNQPIYLVLIMKSLDVTKQKVTKAQMEAKMRSSDDYHGIVAVSNKESDMRFEDFLAEMDRAIKELYNAALNCDIDARGLFVLGLIHCDGSFDEK